MRHCFINSGEHEPPTWRQALPDAVICRPEIFCQQDGSAIGMVWLRLLAGEAVAERVREILASADCPLVVMSDEPDEAMVIAAIAAGASGVCSSHAAPEVLHQLVLVVENGGLWVGRALLQKLAGGVGRALAARLPPVDDWVHGLSEREQEVAHRVAHGASNKEIARALGITERTVKAHLGAVFEKLGVRDRLQLSLRINGIAV